MDTRQTRARSWMSPVPRVRGVYAAGVSAPSTSEDAHAPRGRVLALALGAVGVVYGDIGTSPLYAVNEIFFGHGHVAPLPGGARGCISLVVWALIVVVALKYVLFVLRADNDGEGGVFALYGLLHRYKEKGLRYLLFALMLAAGLLFGDGVITPAISVLSAVEGLDVVTPMFEHAIVPITIVILTGLFSIRFRGTETVGRVFGPILIVWFLTIAGIGALQISRHPQILEALNPYWGALFLLRGGVRVSLLVLGSVMLTVTGGEALYADMGHFGKGPIRVGWFGLVFPALLLNYLGQGAFIASSAPVVGQNLFYSTVPRAFVLPMVVLSTLATIIASQALISGAFSLASQGVGLGLFPRLRVVHTHHAHEGQIYVPFVNWSLCAGCILLVVTFGSSSALASAYGLAVSGVMVATSLAMVPLAWLTWRWSRLLATLLFGSFAACDGAFLLANSLKFLEGGFVPLTLGLALFVVMITWRWGRKATFAAYSSKHTMAMSELIARKKGEHDVLRPERRPDGPQAAPSRGRQRPRAAPAPVRALRDVPEKHRLRRGRARPRLRTCTTTATTSRCPRRTRAQETSSASR